MSAPQTTIQPTPSNRLGAQIGVYPLKGRNFFRWSSLFLITLNTLVSIVILLVGLLTAYTRYYLNGPAVVLNHVWLPVLLAAGLFGMAVWMTWLAYHNWDREVVLYEDGFIYRAPRKTQAWNWEDVSNFYIDIQRGILNPFSSRSRQRYILESHGGKRLTLDDRLERVEELASCIRLCTMPNILAQNSRAYEAGQELSFGPVRVLPTQGLEIKRIPVYWERVQAVRVDKGQVTFMLHPGGDKPPRQIKIAAREVPNLEVLLSIVENREALKPAAPSGQYSGTD